MASLAAPEAGALLARRVQLPGALARHEALLAGVVHIGLKLDLLVGPVGGASSSTSTGVSRALASPRVCDSEDEGPQVLQAGPGLALGIGGHAGGQGRRQRLEQEEAGSDFVHGQ